MNNTVSPARSSGLLRRNPRTTLIILLLLPGLVWLTFFFIIPIVANLSTSLQTGNLELGYKVTWNLQAFKNTFTVYKDQFLRSFGYAFIATAICIFLAFPLCYVIAFKVGSWRKLILALVVAPFFTSLLIRILAWKTIFADQGPVIHFLNDIHFFDLTQKLHLTNPGTNFIGTPLAVVWGLTYNFLPFTILPIYTSLSKIKPNLLEASSDLYSTGFSTFRTVIWPLSLPGIISGTLLTFIPAAGDYVNAQLLGGNTGVQMVGNVVQSQYLVALDYPQAAAVSTVFMVAVVVLVSIYISINKTEDLL